MSGSGNDQPETTATHEHGSQQQRQQQTETTNYQNHGNYQQQHQNQGGGGSARDASNLIVNYLPQSFKENDLHVCLLFPFIVFVPLYCPSLSPLCSFPDNICSLSSLLTVTSFM
jgi:hypothetical protein